jgi:glycosyltransferase involved in cell wall biosynthesis
MNILYVGTLPPHPGGSAVSCSLLLAGLARLGHTVRALGPITPEVLRTGDPFASGHPEIRTTRFLLPYFETSPDLPAPEEYRRLEGEEIRRTLPALVAEERPDVLFIGRETFAWHVPDLAGAASLPCLLRVAGSTLLGMMNGSQGRERTEELLRKIRRVDVLVAVARHMAASLEGLGLTNVTTIPNSVDLDQFAPRTGNASLRRELAIRDDDIVVMHVSNMKTLKRTLDIVDSAELALPRSSKLAYVIVGDGPGRAAMEDACRRKGIHGRFRFVGWMEYPRVPDFISLADIVVMPSEAEAQARVYVETQASGRVLVASDIPAAREVIADGETGLLFRKGDAGDLARKTLLAAGDPGLRLEIGRRARERVQAHSLDTAVAAYAATLGRVVQQHRR